MEEIPPFFKGLIQTFDSLRGKPRESLPVPFWDVVVLTASDDLQKEAFQLQIEDKLSRGRLPTGLPYLVFADPPGPRAGCGGSTMYVISELVKLYGWEKVNSWRIILLNAGGQSQRLPSASVLGKIFTALPIAGSDYQMLEMKLALYLPFLKRMSPGIFHPASDCVELYAMDEDDEWNFTEPGITALAHPSALKIGVGHGVYVLEKKISEGQRRKTEFRTCLKVLQKPSISKMRQEGAVLTDKEENEFVYTDSLFFFDHSVSKRLWEFYKQEAPMDCEIDSYGDFLQPLGVRATIDYTLDTANVSKVESNLVNLRQKIFKLLHNLPLHIVALNASKFYHYGTFEEYLYHLTEDDIIAKEMGFTRVIKSKINGTESHSSTSGRGDSPVRKRPRVGQQGVLMHSAIASGSVLPERCLVEYCHFSPPLKLGESTVISNCEYEGSDLLLIQVPANTFLHTVSIRSEDKVLYVTFVFNVNDDLKKSFPYSASGGLVYFGLPLDEAMEKLDYDKERVFGEKSSEEKCSLWGAALFPGLPTMTESFRAALNIIAQLVSSSPSSKYTAPTAPLFSMVDIMKKKNVSAMLDFRNKISKLIDEK